ncbi:CBS domain-containing protein [Streptomyces sp. NPDC055815]
MWWTYGAGSPSARSSRVVVEDDGRLVGVLSRSDLVQLYRRRDRAIQEKIVENVITRTLSATGGVIRSGTVRRRGFGNVLVMLCDSVDGVVGVVDRLPYEEDELPHEEDDLPGK